jgi:tight adherence protein B
LDRREEQQIVEQFNQFLYTLSSALVAGRSVENAFYELEKDLYLLYSSEDTFIVREVRQINKRIRNGDSVEKAILEFSKRTTSQDIKNFAVVFSTCKRTGGDLVEVIKKTANIINTKIETQQEIGILIARKKFEALLLSIAPIVIIGLITFTVPDYMQPLYETLIGKIVMTVSLGLVIISNLLAKLIMDIKV